MLQIAMDVSLRRFEEADLPLLRSWASRIRSSDYMSRYEPKGENFAQAIQQCVLWSVILVDEIDAGAIWIEKEVGERTAVLGILLGDTALLGSGIGEAAINLALQQIATSSDIVGVRLNVRDNNVRAIACYKKCGFRVVGEGIKGASGNEFTYLTMERRITHDLAT